MSDKTTCAANKKIIFGNDFNTRAEINELFGISRGAGARKGGAALSGVGREEIICWSNEPSPESPWVNAKVKFGPNSDSRGYQEVLEITEENRDPSENEKHIQKIMNTPELRTRHVFWREERNGARWYKFYGTFVLDLEKTNASKKCWFKRVATEVPIG